MKLYGVFDNNQDEPDYFDTYAEAEKCAEEYIDSYNDGDYGWSDDVHHVRIFKIISEATEVDKRTTDEDGEPLANGFDYMCNYHMLPVEPAPAVTVEDVARKVEPPSLEDLQSEYEQEQEFQRGEQSQADADLQRENDWRAENERGEPVTVCDIQRKVDEMLNAYQNAKLDDTDHPTDHSLHGGIAALTEITQFIKEGK